MCTPLMMLMALKILCGRCVLFSESTDLSELSEVVLMAESTAHDWTFNKDDDDEPAIIVNHSGWFRPFLADHWHGQSGHSVMLRAPDTIESL
jgi:hypothetical protein